MVENTGFLAKRPRAVWRGGFEGLGMEHEVPLNLDQLPTVRQQANHLADPFQRLLQRHGQLAGGGRRPFGLAHQTHQLLAQLRVRDR
jgi:hypothetical protein